MDFHYGLQHLKYIGQISGIDNRLPIEPPSKGEDQNGVNRFTSNANLSVLGIEIYRIVDEKQEGNSITTTIKQVYMQRLDWFNPTLNIRLTLENNSSIQFQDGVIELLPTSQDSNSILQNESHSAPTYIDAGKSGELIITGKLRGNKSVAVGTHYDYKITYKLNGEEKCYYYNIVILPMD